MNQFRDVGLRQVELPHHIPHGGPVGFNHLRHVLSSVSRDSPYTHYTPLGAHAAPSTTHDCQMGYAPTPIRMRSGVVSFHTTAMPGKGAKLANRAGVSGDAGTLRRTMRDTAAT